MSSRFTELAVDCRDPVRLAGFWCEVLGWRVTETEPGLVEIAGDDPGPSIVFVEVPEPKTVKNRVHIDVSPRDREQADEVDRILGLGARRADVGQGDDASWVVLADPEDNEFCVLSTRRP
ncbi:MAG TPA: VOC family protein [Actinomycetota bacterium]|nr:VOC family protein [Actinomycetota bacterium]